MIKVSVMYPKVAGARFEFDYYAGHHARLVKDLLGDALQRIEVDRGVSGPSETDAPQYVAALHLYFENEDVYRTSFGPHASIFRADIPNYTDLKPSVQISEVSAVI